MQTDGLCEAGGSDAGSGRRSTLAALPLLLLGHQALDIGDAALARLHVDGVVMTSSLRLLERDLSDVDAKIDAFSNAGQRGGVSSLVGAAVRLPRWLGLGVTA